MIEANWLAWCLQVLVLSAVGCLAPRLLRVTDAQSRLLGAQFTLLICLLLPFAGPRFPTGGKVQMGTGGSLSLKVPGRRIPLRRPSRWQLLIPGILAAGAIFRLAGLAGGIWKLDRYRASAGAAAGPVEEACLLVGCCCPIALSGSATGPATFGLFRPMVLVPERFLKLPHEAQLAVLCHELIHVRRNDWAAALAEEFCGALLWFQPAVWVLLADIRLAREQVVDRRVVELTASKSCYVEALLAVAGEPFAAAISMAPMFLHRKNLKSRVKFLLEEWQMSKTMMLVANVSLAALLGVAGWVSTVTFPFVAVAQEKGSITVAEEAANNYDFSQVFSPATGPRLRIGAKVLASNLIRQVKPAYPADAKAARVQGTVKLGILVGTDGHIADLVLISGNPLLVPASSQAVRQWVYRPTLLNGQPVEVISVVDVTFTLNQ